MLVVLFLLCVFLCLRTIEENYHEGAAAAQEVAGIIAERHGQAKSAVIVGRGTGEDREFAADLQSRFSADGIEVVGVVQGQPPDAREVFEKVASDGKTVDVVACVHATSSWKILENLDQKFEGVGAAEIVSPQPYRWPTFLTRANLLNVANQVAVIAIVAIGMTMVIITAGIDLSVGSLIALCAVVGTVFIRDNGGENASASVMVLGGLLGILAGGLAGFFNGLMVSRYRVPPFITTLAVMLIGSGCAYIWSDGNSIFELPKSFDRLGVGTTFGLPNTVILMVVLYVAAHVLMSRTSLGRYIYSVGGNEEAARLSGVPVKRVILFVYTLTGLLAGLAGIITASKLKSGAPQYGLQTELEVIAAVVVGGTSLMGGEGRIFGTLIGAFIIGVMANGLNLMGVDSNWQPVVLGAVILGAVLTDLEKKRRFG